MSSSGGDWVCLVTVGRLSVSGGGSVVDVVAVIHCFGGDQLFFGADAAEGAELFAGGAEAAFDALLVEGQAVENFCAGEVVDGGVAEEDAFDFLRGFEFLGAKGVVGVFRDAFDQGVEDVFVDGLRLSEPPGEVGDAIDDGRLERSDGVHVVDECAAEVFEVCALVGSDEETPGEQAVFEGVFGDSVFAGGGFGAGGLLGVGAVGVDLGLGGHGVLLGIVDGRLTVDD